ncbi:putative oxidoreductase [Xylaria intraflava]|nr:putative oxidoreductase [Xylaria intraflava]
MGSVISRLTSVFNPPEVAKSENALRFGILGAANVTTLALLGPAKSHPEVVLQAVASRDLKKAQAYAQKNGIPEARGSYQEIIDDPNIDCVFIPLPNSMHFEWAVKAIRAGKHVLLEKPSVSNTTEAETLFNLPELSKPDGPVLMEAFHNRFHPAWALFTSLVKPEEVAHVVSKFSIPWWGTSKGDIGFNYSLSGGTMMHIGTYNFAAIRDVFGAEPEECLSCDVGIFKGNPMAMDKIDGSFKTTFRFPNGGIAEAEGSFRGGTILTPSSVVVTHKEVVVPDDMLPPSQQKSLTREVTIYEFIQSVAWHRVDIKDAFVIRNSKDNKVIKKWEEKKSQKAYTFREAGGQFSELPGETFWSSYRHQLEQFVNRVKGRETRYWIDRQDSVNQMRMVDLAYEKSGLGRRPTSTFKVE